MSMGPWVDFFFFFVFGGGGGGGRVLIEGLLARRTEGHAFGGPSHPEPRKSCTLNLMNSEPQTLSLELLGLLRMYMADLSGP